LADPQDPTSPPPESPPPPGGQIPLGGDGGGKNHIPVNIEDEMRRSYLDYAMSVIVGRALPDVRDGLKPVHRRILYVAIIAAGMLKIGTVKWRGRCPQHPTFDPEADGPGAIRSAHIAADAHLCSPVTRPAPEASRARR
jgi:hypothetical protein